MIILWFLLLVFLGPRFITVIWWLIEPNRFSLAFGNFLVPMLGIVFLPWTTLMYMLVFPGGLVGFDWLWIALAFFGDLSSYLGGGAKGIRPLVGGKKVKNEAPTGENS